MEMKPIGYKAMEEQDAAEQLSPDPEPEDVGLADPEGTDEAGDEQPPLDFDTSD